MSTLQNEAILEGIFDDCLTELEARLNKGVYSEDEIADNTARLSRFLTGQVCLAFSNLDPKKFDEAMQAYEV